VRRWVRDAAAEVHDALTARAAAGLRNPPQPRELTGYQAEMVLNGVYLVADDEVETFSGLVRELDDRHRSHGMRLEVTGPWPPYNFVEPLAAA
jgi:Gas vesicle synthesis protein GvpL/GvpF